MKTSLRIFCSLLILHIARGHDGHTGSMNQYSEEGCDEEKGCFLCIDECGGNAAWEPFENVIHFTVWGPLTGDTGYISMGISPNNEMFSADVYSCIVDGGVGSLKRYWNPASGRSPMLVATKGVSDEDVSLVDGEIRCKFTRNMTLNDGDPQFYDISGNSSYFLLLASANSLNGDGITYHGQKRGASAEVVVLSQTFSAGAGAEPGLDLMKAHGCLMIIAWIGLVSVGITLARYYKPMWPNSKLGGVKVWFALHRACMVTALLMFVAAFVIIFVHVGDIIPPDSTTADTKRRFAHTVLGLIVTGLGILNPTMALCRPHPGTPNRPIFNWAHWGVGTSALLLAFVTVGLALAELGGTTILPGLDGYVLWVLVAFGVFHVLMWVILEILRMSTDSNGRTDDIPLGVKGDDPPPTASDDNETPSGSVLKNILLAIYCLGAVFAIAFMVITIAIV